jgi:hypothetical protein
LNSIAVNQYCTYFVTNCGAFSIGSKESGLLGFQNTALLLNYPIPMDMPPKIKVKGVSASSQHVLTWDTDGRLYSWGSNLHGKLGIDSNYKNDYFVLKPTLVETLAKKRVYTGLAGVNSSFVITNKGQIYYWGKPFNSVEGRGSVFTRPTKLEKSPKTLEVMREKNLFEKIVFVKLVNYGYNYGAIDIKGRVFTFGENNTENLGFALKDTEFYPEEANLLGQVLDMICMDIALSEKNLFLILEKRDKKNECWFVEGKICREFIGASKNFTVEYLKDLKKMRTNFDIGITAHHMVANLIGMGVAGSGVKNYQGFENRFIEPETPIAEDGQKDDGCFTERLDLNTEAEKPVLGLRTLPNFHLKMPAIDKFEQIINKKDQKPFLPEEPKLLSNMNTTKTHRTTTTKPKNPVKTRQNLRTDEDRTETRSNRDLDDSYTGSAPQKKGKPAKIYLSIAAVKKRIEGLDDLPFLPSTKAKILKRFTDFTEVEEDPFEPFENGTSYDNNMLTTYRTF